MAGTPVDTRPFERVCPAGQRGRARVWGRGQGQGRARGGRGEATAWCHVGGRGQGQGAGPGIRTGRGCRTALEGQDPGCGGLAWGWPRGA